MALGKSYWLTITETSYTLAEDLNKQLDDLSRNLSQMIEQVNKISTSQSSLDASTSSLTNRPGTPSASAADAASQMPDDPVSQLSAILGAHLRALSSIDSSAGKLSTKVGESETKMGSSGSARGWGLPRR